MVRHDGGIVAFRELEACGAEAVEDVEGVDVVVSGLLKFFREARGKCELFGVGHAVLRSGGAQGGA